jgi:hypothetical protein
MTDQQLLKSGVCMANRVIFGRCWVHEMEAFVGKCCEHVRGGDAMGHAMFVGGGAQAVCMTGEFLLEKFPCQKKKLVRTPVCLTGGALGGSYCMHDWLIFVAVIYA